MRIRDAVLSIAEVAGDFNSSSQRVSLAMREQVASLEEMTDKSQNVAKLSEELARSVAKCRLVRAPPYGSYILHNLMILRTSIRRESRVEFSSIRKIRDMIFNGKSFGPSQM
ncbi:MAG: hypothetical protein ACFFGZ_17390 [Candidatus Thorarchaeota archaeon]